ncbi:MAG: 4-hydroxythreonine-4-phosphate dehydrogenase PdxA [bacterium]
MIDKVRLAISLGDPAGIGLEVTAKAILALKSAPIRFVLACNESYFAHYGSRFEWGAEILELAKPGNSGSGAEIEFLGEPELRAQVSFGIPTAESGYFAYESLITAAENCIEECADALVTAPLSKTALKMAGHDFPGHTEILQKLAGVPRVVMAFIAGDNRVVPATRHIALRDVPNALTPELIDETIGITSDWLIRYEGIDEPRIGVLALNPHAGEDGIMGGEESIIIEGMTRATGRGYNVSGPIVPDTAFLWKIRSAYDVLIGMFHDQVLIPFKMMAFEEGVNATLGLPFIRTSPDHGTAFAIAGKGVASHGSMKSAIELAERWARATSEG